MSTGRRTPLELPIERVADRSAAAVLPLQERPRISSVEARPKTGVWMNAADAVQAVEFACHRALKGPKDDMSRVMLLEALANLKATPLASFPQDVLELVERSRDQADALSDRILASNSLSAPSIDQEIRVVCHTLGFLAAAMRPAGDINAGGGEGYPERPG